MASVNSCTFVGNIGKDCEMRYLANATAQAKFSLAVNYRRKGANGEYEDQTEWVNVVLWGDRAEKLTQYLTKGKTVYVNGRLQTRTWDDDQGQKHYMTEIVANQVELLSKPEGTRPDSRAARDDFDTDDLPFS